MSIDWKLEKMIIKASIARSNAVNKRFGVCNYLSPSGGLFECVGFIIFILQITNVLEFLAEFQLNHLNDPIIPHFQPQP